MFDNLRGVPRLSSEMTKDCMQSCEVSSNYFILDTHFTSILLSQWKSGAILGVNGKENVFIFIPSYATKWQNSFEKWARSIQTLFLSKPFELPLICHFILTSKHWKKDFQLSVRHWWLFQCKAGMVFNAEIVSLIFP